MDMAEIEALVAEHKNFLVDRYIQSGDMPASQAVELAFKDQTFHYVLSSIKPMTEELFQALLNNSQPYFLRQLALNDTLTTEMHRKLYLVQDDELQRHILARIDDKDILAQALASGSNSKVMGAVLNKLVTPEQLNLAADINDPDILSRIASNKNSTLEILEKCVKKIASVSKLPFYTYSSVISHPNVTSELIDFIYSTYGLLPKEDWSYASYLGDFARSPKTPKYILLELAKSVEIRDLVSNLMKNPAVDAQVQEIILKRGDENELKVMCKSENVDPSILEQLLKHSNPEVRSAIVSRPDLTADQSALLFNDVDAIVRAEFALRSDLSEEHIKTLVGDKSALVREYIAEYDVDNLEFLAPLTEDKSVKVFTAITSLKKRSKSGEYLDAPERKWLVDAATTFKAGVKPKKKPVTIGDKVSEIKKESLTQERFDELSKEESVTLRVAAIMRGHEVGLIDLPIAVKLLDAAGTTGVAPREAWLKDRALNWQKIKLQTALDMQFYFKSSMEDLLGKNNELPEDFLIRVIKVRYGKYNWAIYQNQKLTKNCLMELVDSEMFYGDGPDFIQVEMLSNKLMDLDVYKALTACKFKVVRTALYADPKTPREVLDMGLEDKDGDIRAGVIANPRYKYSEVERFLGDRGYASKIGVLRREDCPAAVLEEHASSKQMEVRLTVAANPSTPSDALLLLAADGEKEVRKAAVANPRASAEVKAIATLLN